MSYLENHGRPREVVIGEHNYHHYQQDVVVDGERKARGLVPRNYQTHPRGCYSWATAADFPLIPAGERAARIAQKTAEKSQLSDIRATGGPNGGLIPARDQGQKGYCWAHSGVAAHLLVRAKQGLVYADLSAYSIACVIKNFADEGGWGAQGVDYEIANGCATSATWPQQSMSRANINDAMKADAANHKIIGQWADLARAQYDRNLTWDQTATLLLSDIPVVIDLNWWGHSICGMDLVANSALRAFARDESGKLMTVQEFDFAFAMNDPVTAGQSIRILNSWSNTWGSDGAGLLTGSKAVPDGAVAPVSVTLSA